MMKSGWPLVGFMWMEYRDGVQLGSANMTHGSLTCWHIWLASVGCCVPQIESFDSVTD